MSNRKKKTPLWLPYTQSITVKGKTLTFEYNGGTETAHISEIHSIMFYGSLCPLEEQFLELCVRHKVPVVFHRRNMPVAVWINDSGTGHDKDILTQQVLFRENERKRRHIARKILDAKFRSMSWLIAPPHHMLTPGMSIKELRMRESWHARHYWQKFYDALGYGAYSRRGGSGDNELTKTLDAVSKFVSGICLRWVTYHHLSPYHGFIHEPTDYPSLCYDLLEPHRGDYDRVVFRTAKEIIESDQDHSKILPASIEAIKAHLDEKVYVNATRQIVTRHELLHGGVLSLRSYLLGNASRMLVPRPSQPNGGRPVKAGFQLYGRHAGKTDYWKEARALMKDQQNKYGNIPTDNALNE